MAQGGYAVEQATEPGVPIRLECFLQWIEVQNQGIGFDHLNGAEALLCAIAIVQLYRTEVGEEQDAGRDIAYLIGALQ